MRLRQHGFTLLEIIMAIAIVVLIMLAAVPSVQGILSERTLTQSFEAFDDLARKAQALSLSEQRPYLLVWGENEIRLVPAEPATEEETKGQPGMELAEKESLEITFPAALVKDPPREWIFWPTGTCEPATITFTGKAGRWLAQYDPLTVRAAFSTE
jgi:prepilin-type N-terminal cleavage/methylation domain-containing protein